MSARRPGETTLGCLLTAVVLAALLALLLPYLQAAAPGEAVTTWPLASGQFLNHTLYWPSAEAPPGAPTIDLTDAQLAWIGAGLGYFADVQAWLLALEPDTGGAYCLGAAPFLEGFIVWPTTSCAPGVTLYGITTGQLAWTSGGFDAMDAVQTFIRLNGSFP